MIRFVKRFFSDLAFRNTEDRTGSFLAWIIVVSGILC